jgi:hypothetical protein
MMMKRGFFIFLSAGLILSGCGRYKEHANMVPPDGAEKISISSNPEYGAYLLARERLNQVKLGMTRKEFIDTLQLRRVPSEDWYKTFSGGDGWLVELSRMNRVAGEVIEEYSFGYHENRRVVERDVVSLKNGKVVFIRNFPPAREAFPNQLDFEIAGTKSRQDENQLIRKFVRKKHASPTAFNRAMPGLKRIRVGMTAGEMRSLLGGYFYRFRNGYVYFADGFLWGPNFQAIETSTGSLTVMPFGYVKEGKEVQRFAVKLLDGVVTEVREIAEKAKVMPEKKSSLKSSGKELSSLQAISEILQLVD